jgi:hypothetical protein
LPNAGTGWRPNFYIVRMQFIHQKKRHYSCGGNNYFSTILFGRREAFRYIPIKPNIIVVLLKKNPITMLFKRYHLSTKIKET